MSNIHHIHVDGTQASPELLTALVRMGFYTTDFCGHPPEFDHFEPQLHLSKKLPSRTVFDEYWERASALIAQHPDFVGYLEGEEIPFDDAVEEKPYTPGIPVPFHITRRKLRGAECDEIFRSSELHLTLDKDASDPRLIKSLLEAGLYGAYLPKRNHTALVLTMQAARREDLAPLIVSLRDYVTTVGGAVHATLKEEIAIKYELFGIKPAQLPEIIDSITYW